MINKQYIIDTYREFCTRRRVPFTEEGTVSPYDNTTLFCPAGMQQFKPKFKDINYKGTIANVQPCIRTNDFDEIGDGSHLLYFNMIGLFSFRTMTLFEAVEFWMEFIKMLGVELDYVTIHPDKSFWKNAYKNFKAIKFDSECKWTDGDIGGYCTEFYSKGIEIGNIVNPLGNCIDVGFGLERLMLALGEKPLSRVDVLKEAANKIIDSGYFPSNVKQGYVLRKILREIYKLGGKMDNPYFLSEVKRQEAIVKNYNRLKDKHIDKSKEWWFDTHGINIDEL